MEVHPAERFTTRDGSELLVRPIAPDDRAAFLQAFEHLSDETRYRRFLAPIKRLKSRELDYFTEVDHRDHEALIALTLAGEIIGVARYVRLEGHGDTAEVAVTVADAWQGRGVGTALLDRLAKRARCAGIETFRGICLAGNTDMRQLLKKLGPGARTSSPEGGLVEIEAKLRSPGDLDGPLAHALRAAARGHHDAKGTRDASPPAG